MNEVVTNAKDIVLNLLSSVSIITLFLGLGRLIWWAARMDYRMERAEKDLNAAHAKIRSSGDREKP